MKCWDTIKKKRLDLIYRHNSLWLYLEASMSLWMLFLKGFYFGKNPPLEQAFNSADPAHVIWPLPHNTVP